MIVLLLRHAHAGDRDADRWPDDTLRPLTPRGRATQRRMARWLREQGLRPTLILSSPWKRAWQTAEIVAREAAPRVTPRPCPALAMTPGSGALVRAIGAQDKDAVVALVGHEPWMSELASLLLMGRRESVRLDFPKSGILGLEMRRIEAGTAVLRFFLRPKQAGRAG